MMLLSACQYAIKKISGAFGMQFLKSTVLLYLANTFYPNWHTAQLSQGKSA